MASTTKFLTLAAATATVAGGLLAGAGAAQANPSDTNTCQPGQLNAVAEQVPSDSLDTNNFVITFAATPGTQCLLTGTPQNLVFYSAGGAELGVDSYATDSQNTQVLVDQAHPAQVDLHAPHAQTPGAPAARASFTMANSTDGVPFTIAWPAEVNGPVEIGSLLGGNPN